MNEKRKLSQQERELAKRFLDCVAADPRFREQLLDDPASALRDGGFAEEIRQLQSQKEDVSGYGISLPRGMLTFTDALALFLMPITEMWSLRDKVDEPVVGDIPVRTPGDHHDRLV